MRRALSYLWLSALTCTSLVSACGSDDEDVPRGDAAVQEAGIADANNVVPSDSGVSSGAPDAGGNVSGNDAGSMPTRDAGGGIDAGGARDAGVPADTGTSTAEAGGGEAGATLPKFSFFVTSLNAMRTLSKSQNGFGGDFRFGETGDGAGLRGADKICAAAAEIGLPGAGAKEWRAFLSTSTVNARTRIGAGPWYDRKGRLIAQNLTALLKERPEGAEAAIRDDLPNELGDPNRAGSAEGAADDNHDVVTGTNASGDYDGSNTCSDWTSTTATGTGGGGIGGQNGPRIGHSWPAMSGRNWMAAHRAPGCAPSVALVQTGGGSGTGIGNGGGYGGIYCFALTP
jgi:hypothetical protein